MTNLDPDGFECYSDHAHDIETQGECMICTSTEVDTVGHILPGVKRYTNVDPVRAARMVVYRKSGLIFDGMLLDHFTAAHIVAVADALSDAALPKLRAMSLPKAAAVCFKLAEKGKTA